MGMARQQLTNDEFGIGHVIAYLQFLYEGQ